MQDEQLVERYLEGDAEAFNELGERYQQRIFLMAQRMLGNHADAQDAVQEVLVRLMRALPKFHARAKFSTWLYRLASNTIIDCRRRRFRGPAVVGLDTEGAQLGNTDGPEHICEAGFREYLLNQALLALPESQRELVVLRDREELSNQEVANILGIDINTLKSRLHRARGALRRVLEQGVTVSGHEALGRFQVTPDGTIS